MMLSESVPQGTGPGAAGEGGEASRSNARLFAQRFLSCPPEGRKTVCRHAGAALTHHPVHLLHVVPVQPVAASPEELPGGDEGRVDV